MIWVEGEKGKTEEPFQVPPGEAWVESGQEGTSYVNDPRRAHRRWRQVEGVQLGLQQGRAGPAARPALHHPLPQQAAPGNGLPASSRDPKFETWLWTLIIIKSQTGNFQTMSC